MIHGDFEHSFDVMINIWVILQFVPEDDEFYSNRSVNVLLTHIAQYFVR